MKEKIKLSGKSDTGTVMLEDVQIELDQSLNYRNYSPDQNFQWGYTGSGPLQLALEVMLNLVTEEQALRMYRLFRYHIISKLPMGKDFKIVIELKQFIEDFNSGFLDNKKKYFINLDS